MKKMSNKGKFIIIFIITTAIVFIINETVYGEVEKFSQNSQFHKRNVQNFQYLSIAEGLLSLEYSEIGLANGQSAVFYLMLGASTGDQSYIELAGDNIKRMTESINHSGPHIKGMTSSIAKVTESLKLSSQNDTMLAKFNSGLPLIRMSPFFLSLAIVPLSINKKENNNSYDMGIKISFALFGLGIILWCMGFVNIIINLIF